MSNYRALGFTVAGRADAEALARAPLRRAEGQLRLLGGEGVRVHRLEVGEGIELWSIVAGRRVVASYPTFLARGRRPARLGEVTAGRSPYAPWVALPGAGVELQLVNYPFVPPERLRPDCGVELALAALLPGGLQPTTAPPGWQPSVAPARTCAIVGQVLACETFANALTGQPVVWANLACGTAGELETVCHGEDAVGVAPGAIVGGRGTLRGALTGWLNGEEGQTSE